MELDLFAYTYDSVFSSSIFLSGLVGTMRVFVVVFLVDEMAT